jgi:hypothetical protein
MTASAYETSPVQPLDAVQKVLFLPARVRVPHHLRRTDAPQTSTQGTFSHQMHENDLATECGYI